MKNILMIGLFFVLAISFAPSKAQAVTLTGGTVLILYDAHGGDADGKVGLASAIMLSNLMGHFNLNSSIQDVAAYTAGKMETFYATFYLGTYYDNPVPSVFFVDVAKTTKPLIWFRYNIWQMAQNPTYGFAAKFGFDFVDLRSLDGAPTADGKSPGFFDTITYKTKVMKKFYSYDAANNVINADPDAGLMTITNATKAKQIVPMKDSKTLQVAPYIIQSGNFWYVADLPFSFIGPQDRYLVICDILHDMLKVTHAVNNRALIRLEDVTADVDPATTKTLADYFKSKNMPFTVAAVPHYKDPNGYYNNGVPQDIKLSQATNLLASMRYMVSKGGKINLHGYTHQYSNIPNLYTGVTGGEYEFWNGVTNSPVAEDSVAWALGRIDAGQAEMAASGFTTVAWTTPQYQASAATYRALAQRGRPLSEQVSYFTADHPNFDPNSPTHDQLAAQFFPYIIDKDYYGNRVLPESLGAIQYDISNIDPFSNQVYTWQTIRDNAAYHKVVRDGFASFYFHPYWLSSDLAYLHALADFKNLVSAIQGMGYTFVDAATAK